jgi:hypothetical protein
MHQDDEHMPRDAKVPAPVASDAKNQLALDALQPATQDFGQTVRPLGREAGELAVELGRTGIRTVRALLRPVTGLVWGVEQIEDWLQETIEQKLSDVPEERRIEPPLLIAGPAIQAVRFASNEPELRDMFANLLARSMDADTAGLVHPAYVEVIKQLAPAEARMLRFMANRGAGRYSVPFLDLMFMKPGDRLAPFINYFSTLPEEAGWRPKEHTEGLRGAASFMANIRRLQILETHRRAEELSDVSHYAAVEGHPWVVQLEGFAKREGWELVKRRGVFEATSFGALFLELCAMDREFLFAPLHDTKVQV